MRSGEKMNEVQFLIPNSHTEGYPRQTGPQSLERVLQFRPLFREVRTQHVLQFCPLFREARTQHVLQFCPLFREAKTQRYVAPGSNMGDLLRQQPSYTPSD